VFPVVEEGIIIITTGFMDLLNLNIEESRFK
jgi:hypothetical protein